MKFKCDRCDKPATFHLTDISDSGEAVAKHLCSDCAADEGIHVKADVPISQLLEEFIMSTTSADPSNTAACDVCGTTFGEFQEEGRLGCPHDYDAFAEPLKPLLQDAHEGATEHVGKVPHRAGGDQQKATAILRLRAELKRVVATEDYERAAVLRDQIHELENL